MLRTSEFEKFWGISRSLIGLQYGVLRSVMRPFSAWALNGCLFYIRLFKSPLIKRRGCC